MSPEAEEESLVPVMRALIECWHQVERVSSRAIEATGLTPAQFDVLAVLGETDGMTCSELGRRTLITKGTLSPVLDRLEAKQMLTRRRGEVDGRQIIVGLTSEGEATFQATFYPHIEAMRGYLDKLPPDHQTQLIALLRELQAAFTPGADTAR